MKNKKLLFILMPVLIVVLVLIAWIVFVALNSSPEKIFKNSITKVFSMIDISNEDYSTVKGTMNFTGGIELGDIETEYKDRLEGLEKTVQTINDILEGSSINVDMEADLANMIINENINVILNNENLLNAAIILQDQKGYMYLKDYLDKYLELPEEELDYSELSDLYKKSATLNQNLLMDVIEEELIRAISNQNLLQEDTTLVLDGQETKVTASILSLKDEQMITFYIDFLNRIKQNEEFQVALGEYKEEILEAINQMIIEMEDTVDVQYLDVEFIFTIYTRGFLNEFVGISVKDVTSYLPINSYKSLEPYTEEVTGFDILKHNEGNYQILAYDEYEGKREDAFNITVENNKESKNKGTTTITITAEEETFIVTYNYEKQGEQLSFVLSTEIEGVRLSISGNTVENGNNIKGNTVISVQEETFGRANLNYTYDFTYGVQIQKVDTRNSVLIDEMSDEDQTTLMTNLQNSPLYELIEKFEGIDSELDTLNDEPEVTNGQYTVIYNIPTNFKSSSYNSNSDDMKMYTDENSNIINVCIRYNLVDTYMNGLEDEYVLKSSLYENQKISDARSYTVKGKEYKFRTITYDDDYGSNVNLYFAHELDDEYCYVVEVESEGGKISMDTIKYFLDVVVEKESLQNMFNDAEEFLDDGQI